MARTFCALLFGALLFSGCAYRFGLAERRIPGGYELVAVPVFKNETPEVGIETYFTNAMVRELERSKLAKVTDKSHAQVVLEGTVARLRYEKTATVTGASGNLPNGAALTTEYRIYVTTSLRLRRNSDQKVLWSATFEKETSYLAPKIGVPGLNSANALYNHSAHYQNIALLAVDMMSEAHDRLTENF